MKILVISDSHGNREKIDFLFKNFTFDYFFFLGDGYKDLGCYVNLDNVFAVRGNCDYGVDAKDEIILKLNGKKILLTHGDNYGVKRTKDIYLGYAKDKKVDIACFGHTHQYYYEIHDGIVLLNPGTFKRQLFGGSNGVILEITDDGEIKVVPFSV